MTIIQKLMLVDEGNYWLYCLLSELIVHNHYWFIPESSRQSIVLYIKNMALED